MKTKKILSGLKWLWTAIVIVGVAYYFSRNTQEYLVYIKHISVFQILLSIVLLIAGKSILAELSRQSVKSENWNPSYSKMFYLYSITQISKYLPGGIWHFVGRFGLYRVNGLNNREASQSIIVENIWLVTSAFFFGAIICLLNPNVLPMIGLTTSVLLNGSLIFASILIWITTNLVISHFFIKEKFNFSDVIWKIATQSAVWLVIGLSFFVLLPIRLIHFETATVSVGGFAIGWALGYITIFAPSGIGVREAIITLTLAAYIQPQEAAMYAAISRLLWILTEIGLGVFSELLFGSGKISNLLNSNR